MKDTIIIGIAGGTGSGKSTFARRLAERFEGNVSMIYHDNYYRDLSHLTFEKRKKVNYDHPDSLETELLIEHLKELKEGRPVECPVYDFGAHNRSGRTVTIRPAPVVIVEGILVLSDPEIRKLLDLKIFVDADADERVLRRIRRDVVKRKRDIDGIIKQYLTTVKPMHNLYVEPAKAKADLVINSGRNEQAFAVAEAFVEKHLKKKERED